MTPPALSSGLPFALASAALYGLNIGFARLASFDGISGSTLVVYRVLLMLALVTLFVLATGRPLAVAREERGTMALLGLSTALVGICYLSSVAFVPVTVAVVVFYTFPILIVVASPVVEGTRLTPALVAVAAVALAGVVMVVGPAFEDLDWRGIALALAASVATATQFFAGARCRRTGVVAKVFWIHLIVLPVSTAIALATGSFAGPGSLAASPYPVAMTIGTYLLGFVLQFTALGRISALAAGIVYCAEPVVAALSSTVILGEVLTPLQMAGGSLVIAAIIGNMIASSRPAKPVAAAQRGATP
jgi:drug/metabolite transporter (DMT)-like permease